MIENGTLLQDRYLIEKQIGAGGMGAVYLAIDRRFDSFVAIKETFYNDAELGAAFEREARLLNGLNHSSLPHVSDFFIENNIYFLVMQFIEGEDLSEILKREGAFAFEKVQNWTDRLLDALEFLHSQEPPIIHRDIKPQNLKLTPRGEIVLLDFGLAKLNSEETSSVKSVFGYSRKYSPLEQIQGTGTDARSDIFSLAATVYHLLTGKPPIDVLARASEIVAGRADPLPPANEVNNKIPNYFANILQKSLALNSDQRFASAAAMRDALKDENEIVVRESGIAAAGIFPALESFASVNEKYSEQTANIPAISDEKVLETNVESNAFNGQSSQPISNFTANVVETRRNNRRLPLALAAVLLLSVILASGYFALRSQNTSEAYQIPTAQETMETNANVADPVENLANSQNQENDQILSDAAEVADQKEAIVPTEVKTKPPAKSTSPTPNRTQNQPRNNVPAENGETRERIVEDEPILVDEIPETRAERNRRRNERIIREEDLSDEEIRELRRERRERRQRRNRNRIPPY